jgi:protocatechuate 3,4-dioxygenase, alpha subunit
MSPVGELRDPMVPTPSQTVGPFFAIGMAQLATTALVDPSQPGALRLYGQVRDGHDVGVPDALVEIWQPDDSGRFASPLEASGWQGFGRCLTDEDGDFAFNVLKPGAVDGQQAPHIDVSVFARGLMQRLMTRVYFPDEEEANEADPVLRSVSPERRATLVAQSSAKGLRFNLQLQGTVDTPETVFFAW